MKKNELNSLLEKYREGTLSDSELDELNRLSGRDEVSAAADSAARVIVRRRVRLGAGVMMLALVVAGAVVWSIAGKGTQSQMEVAEAVEPQAEAPVPVEEAVQPLPLEEEQIAMVQPIANKAETRRAAQRNEIRSAAVVESQPVVVCNNQCEADSVISEIRRFLAV